MIAMKDPSVSSRISTFFKDKDGAVVIWQWPNIPIIGWLVCATATRLIGAGAAQHLFAQLSTAFLFTWAYLEISSGASYFRRLLGGIVMLAIILGIR